MFGVDSVSKTFLLFTFSPSQKRFKNFEECRLVIESDFQRPQDKKIKNLLSLFLGIKFVDLIEPTDTMDPDEIALYEKQRKREASIIIEEITNFNLQLFDITPLRCFVFDTINKLNHKFKEILIIKEEMLTLKTRITEKQSFTMWIESLFFYDQFHAEVARIQAEALQQKK
jgi:hypothetical protein